MGNLAPLERLRNEIGSKLGRSHTNYTIPSQWIDPQSPFTVVQKEPYHWWHNTINTILAQPAREDQQQSENWSRYAHVYNLFIRTGLAFDHDGDGQLGHPNHDQFNETGSFVKAICLLPYIQQLGCNTIHLLPITAIGKDGNKGDAGSPYAIRNPYQLDQGLIEPSLNLTVEEQFAAFVAAAHHLGLRVVVEFVFRTSSKDGDVIAEHPEWFYWIDASVPDRQAHSADPAHYGMPIFTPQEADHIIRQVEMDDLNNLMPPHAAHRQQFLPIPDPANVQMIDGQWRASYPDGRVGRIPGAFADWPVNDSQPPWGDVTYLRLYDHPDFNYIAYNTIRMYDNRYAQPENIVRPLWDYIINIIPHYQTSFNVDGAMIDMGHALPMQLKQELVAKARQINPNFAFWDENFQATIKSVHEGYNAVMGSLPFMLPHPHDLQHHISHLAYEGLPIAIFGAPENHNTPRAASRYGGTAFTKMAVAISAFLPTLPFIHNGLELGDSRPINTGLGFNKEEIAQWPSDQLALFSAFGLDWQNADPNIYAWIAKVLSFRQIHIDLFSDLSAETIGILGSDNPNIRGILRRSADWSKKFGLIYNSDMFHYQEVWMPIPSGRTDLFDIYSEQYIQVSNAWINVKLPPAGVWCVEF